MSAKIVRGDTEIHKCLEREDPKLADDIATILLEEEAKDVYATVVSSQFDADRLDYLRRDRLMTGVAFGHLDVDWLFDCLRAGTKTLGEPDVPREETCLYLSPKGIRVAEEYLEARFRLYAMVYTHETTRAAERMLGRLLVRLAALRKDDSGGARPDWLSGPLACYFGYEEPSLADYLTLDDTVVLSEIQRFAYADDRELAMLAIRLRDRKLYKCFDLGARLDPDQDNSRRLRFYRALNDRIDDGLKGQMLTDRTKTAIYKWYQPEDQSALSMVLVQRDRHDSEPIDIGRFSPVIQALSKQERIERLYVPDPQNLSILEDAWEHSK